jgi:hypothetical protein
MPQHEKLILANGQPQYGIFDEPIHEINHRDFDYRTVMDDKAGLLARYFHFNQFQFIGVLSERFILGCAIADVKYISNAFVYLYDRSTGEFDEISLLQALGRGTRLSRFPDEGSSQFRQRGYLFSIEAHPQPRSRRLLVETRDKIRIDITVTEPDRFQPLSICTRAGYNGWVYTQKATALAVDGRIDWKGRCFTIDPVTCTGSYDWSAGYMRRETAWNWGSLSGFAANGKRIGFNLASGVNETGFTENGFWVDGQLHLVGPVHFHFDRLNRLSTWQMTSVDKRVQVRFEPEGQRTEKINAVLMASNFTQLYGRYYGTLTTLGGQRIELTGQPGFAEDHFARW